MRVMYWIGVVGMMAWAAWLSGCASTGAGSEDDALGEGTEDPLASESGSVAEGEWEASADNLTFRLPTEFPGVSTASLRQAGSEQLLATATMQGIAGPEVRAGETTR
ncbi:MAG: hypothetical protein GF320_14090, partial [Armatimonadia bacterium]|nr:hypothetical protein [Armatimonadia bacterium]